MGITHQRISAYRIMWLFVFFDLPVVEPVQRKRAAKFRKDLLKQGFGMLQYSVYIKHVPSAESAEVYLKRIKKMVPPEGHVEVLKVTDKQFGMIQSYWGKKEKPKKKPPPSAQFELF